MVIRVAYLVGKTQQTDRQTWKGPIRCYLLMMESEKCPKMDRKNIIFGYRTASNGSG
jgi:hypothetical protein